MGAIFRADGSSRLGMGHVMRCLAFADGLDDADLSSVFVTRTFEPHVASLIRSRGYHVEQIPSHETAEEDARLTREIADRNATKLIVTDLCHRSALENREELNTFHQSLARDYFTVCLAGGNAIDIPADILVSPYFGTTYPGSAIDGGRMVLLGPSYFIFRREFIEAARMPRTIAEEPRRVLVTVGGSDKLHMTVRIVKALCLLPQSGLSLRIVLGLGSCEQVKREITDLLAGFSGKYVLVDYDTNLAQAMVWSDLAITGDGLTKYETAVTGTPSIMLSRFDSEKSLNEEFERAGTTLYLGDGGLIDVGMLADEIQSVLRNAPLRMLMSKRGKAMVDGRGLERIITKIPSGLL